MIAAAAVLAVIVSLNLHRDPCNCREGGNGQKKIKLQILGLEMILVCGFENVAGKLSKRWEATAGKSFTKPHTSITSDPV